MGELLRDVGKTNKSLKPIYNGKCSLCDGSGKGRGAFLGTKCNHCIGNEPASHCSCRHCELTMFLRPHYNNKEAVQEAVVYTITTERFSDQGTHQPSKEEVLKSLYGTTSHKPAYKKVSNQSTTVSVRSVMVAVRVGVPSLARSATTASATNQRATAVVATANLLCSFVLIIITRRLSKKLWCIQLLQRDSQTKGPTNRRKRKFLNRCMGQPVTSPPTRKSPIIYSMLRVRTAVVAV